MKYIVFLSAAVSVGLLLTGFYYYIIEDLQYHKYFGFGTVSLFLITFPLFLFWRRNNFKREHYIWQNRSNEPPKRKKAED